MKTIQERAGAYAKKLTKDEGYQSVAKNSYIAGATEEKALVEPTIERIKSMQVKYDENGLDLPSDIQLQRIEQHIDGALSIWQKRTASLEERVKELENTLWAVLSHCNSGGYIETLCKQVLNPKQQ